MLTGQLPWTKRVQSQLFEQIRIGDYSIPMYLTPPCRSFIKGLLTVKVEQRLTINQALEHPWLAGTQRFGDVTCRPGFLSLRLIDSIFGNAFEEIKKAPARLARQESWTPNSFDAVGKLITDRRIFIEDPASIFRKLSCPDQPISTLKPARAGTSHASGQSLPRLTRHETTKQKVPPPKKLFVVKPVPHNLKPRKV
jgi:serine/threonine protein kinase